MNYANNCKDILDLFIAAGKPVPTEDSNMGRAVQILQKICDSQNHTIPDSEYVLDDISNTLSEDFGWNFYMTSTSVWNASKDVAKDVINIPVTSDVSVQHTNFLMVSRHYTGPDRNTVIVLAAKEQEVNIDIASEFFEALEELEQKIGEDDFRLEFDGNEYRMIAESNIWQIYRDEIEETVKDCYDLKLDDIPSFIAISIDWEQTAQNAYADGYGHQFSGYDGSEEEAAGYYIFRTN